ncbi:hypothetical protein PVAND_007186 [Polypedilum vanderplanki]|uniref:DNA replication complex GINS protein PSF3 n=1 Tax=Polypedilum vanderplanki TaxID=319348 RepID=A0A9J6C5G5_POLVA|nr:hypothetical protein PVAND_007186 [Polypedilum vanderplanki]
MSRSFYPNYFSIEDIMVTQEKVPCIVQQDLRSLGFLDPSQMSSDLKANQEVELPLWYVLQVQKDRSRSQFYDVKIPNIYRATYGDICKADATAVDLGKLNKHFYEFGRYVSLFDRNGFVGKMIYETCRSRMKYLKDLCNNINNEQRNEHKLDYIENLFLQQGRKTNKKFDEWYKISIVPIKTSEMVINHRKRKRALMEAESVVSQKR